MEIGNVLKGTEAALEETHNQLKDEMVGAVVLQRSLDDLRGSLEAEKGKAVEAVLVTFRKFEAFEDITSEYYISRFETLHCYVLRACPLLDLSLF